MSSNYVPLSQDDPGNGHVSSSQDTSKSLSSSTPRVFIVLVVALFLVNIVCLTFTTHQVKLVSETLRTHLDYLSDTRDLPRPDPYDGLGAVLRK